MATNLEETIKSSIASAIKSRIDAAREEIIVQAVKEFEKQVRREVGNATIDLTRYFSVQRMADDIVIHIKDSLK